MKKMQSRTGASRDRHDPPFHIASEVYRNASPMAVFLENTHLPEELFGLLRLTQMLVNPYLPGVVMAIVPSSRVEFRSLNTQLNYPIPTVTH
jgi:hypothetical protein